MSEPKSICWRIEAERDALRAALIGMVEKYCDLVNSGDAGFWDPEEVPEVIAARAALAPPPSGHPAP